MTKNEFLVSFQKELQKRHIPDWEEVLSEYEQHFALKQADGFIEEEIAAKLGAPAELAAQFEAADEGDKTASRPAAHLIRFGVGAMRWPPPGTGPVCPLCLCIPKSKRNAVFACAPRPWCW